MLSSQFPRLHAPLREAAERRIVHGHPDHHRQEDGVWIAKASAHGRFHVGRSRHDVSAVVNLLDSVRGEGTR